MCAGFGFGAGSSSGNGVGVIYGDIISAYAVAGDSVINVTGVLFTWKIIMGKFYYCGISTVRR